MIDHRDDPILRAVAALRGPLDAHDICPQSERAGAILAHVLRSATVSAPTIPRPAATAPAAVIPAAASAAPALRRARRVPRRPLAGLAAVAAVTLAALALAGVFTGPGDTGAQPADAVVLRGVAAAFRSRPGTILVTSYLVSGTAHGRPDGTFRLRQVFETPAGPGPQNSLYVSTDRISPQQLAVSNGDEEVYMKSTNTIYIHNVFGARVHPGTRPGTFVYRIAGSRIAPLPLTAAQARALRDGTDQVLTLPADRSAPARFKLSPVAHFPSNTASELDLLEHHLLKVAGTTTIRGRRVIVLAGPKWNPYSEPGAGGVTIYVDPRTYAPVRETIRRPPLFTQVQNYVEYRTVPITAANERLLSLRALHPTARIDRSPADYRRAAHGMLVYTG